MARPRHPNKEIEGAVKLAENLGWSVRISNGHAWGRLYCPQHTRDGCMIVVWSTPRNGGNHARSMVRKIEMCRHSHEEVTDDEP